MEKKISTKTSYFRNMIFGAEDSLVSTVGVLFGLASTTYDQTIILTTGLLVISVEALSMGAGAFLSETSAKEISESGNEQEESTVVDGVIMFLSYFLAGFITLTPYALIDSPNAKYVSILFSLVALFFLGFIPKKDIKSGIRMMVVAGFAIFVGFLIGNIAEIYLL